MRRKQSEINDSKPHALGRPSTISDQSHPLFRQGVGCHLAALDWKRGLDLTPE